MTTSLALAPCINASVTMSATARRLCKMSRCRSASGHVSAHPPWRTNRQCGADSVGVAIVDVVIRFKTVRSLRTVRSCMKQYSGLPGEVASRKRRRWDVAASSPIELFRIVRSKRFTEMMQVKQALICHAQGVGRCLGRWEYKTRGSFNDCSTKVDEKHELILRAYEPACYPFLYSMMC